MMAPAAFADQIGDAAKKLGDASYDFAKEVDWNNGVFLQAPGIRALGGWARSFAVGLGRVMFADVSLGWFMVIFLPNKIRVWHDVSNLTHQITSRAVDRMMYAYTDVRSNFLIRSSSGSVCLWLVDMTFNHQTSDITWSVLIDVAWCG